MVSQTFVFQLFGYMKFIWCLS